MSRRTGHYQLYFVPAAACVNASLQGSPSRPRGSQPLRPRVSCIYRRMTTGSDAQFQNLLKRAWLFLGPHTPVSRLDIHSSSKV
jgi:hypothetical protein